MSEVKYTPWQWDFICHRPRTGSTWWRGNFTLGLHIDSHPRWINVIVCLVFVEFGIGWYREAEITQPYDTINGIPWQQ